MKTSLKFILVLIISLSMFDNAQAGASDLWEGKGRIALSSDGNEHDNDDMQATMMSLMILAKARLQPHTVLYTYADHIWGSDAGDVALMKESAEGAGTRFGFQDCLFIAAVDNPEAAYNAMRDEILKSTADDPLYIIAAGPMEVIGVALDRANATNSEPLNHVTVISHSWWNNNHADNYETADMPHGPEPAHSGWTFAEMVTAFGSKVNFNQISDQNGTTDQPYKTKDKFSAPAWSSWAWMGDHQDPNIQWVYTRGMSNPCGPDYSDAGMAYYFVADLNGVRGDEFGNPVKLQQWIGPNTIDVVIDPTRVGTINITPRSFTIENIGDTKQLTATVTPETAVDKSVTWSSDKENIATVDSSGMVTGIAKGNCKITATTVDGGKIATSDIQVGTIEAGETTVADDFIAIEADATNSELGKWVVRKPGSPGYDAIQGSLDPINNSYIEYTGSTLAGLGVAAGTDALVYKFTPKTTGKYRLTGRMAQRLTPTEGGTKAAWDQCNDIYVKLEGDFTSGNGAPLSILTSWTKLYGRGKDQWGAFIQADVNHQKYQMIYNLKAGEEYTFSISGRSQRCCIDYFVFSKASLTIAEDNDLATANDAQYRPGGCADCDYEYVCEEINSIDFDKYTDMGTGFTDATVDGTRNCLQMPTRLAWGAAEETYTGPDSKVYVTLNAMQETDGESSFKVYKNDTLLAEVTNDVIFDSEIPDYTIQKHDITAERIDIKTGDIFRVEFNSATNGKVPEGNTTATSRGRWKSLSLCTDKTVEQVPAADPQLLSDNAPLKVKVGTSSIDVEITYTSYESLDFSADIHHIIDDSGATEGCAWKRINGVPAAVDGKLNFTLELTRDLVVGDTYRYVMYFMPSGMTWKEQFKPVINIYFDVVTELALDEVTADVHIYPTTFTDIINIESAEMIKRARLFNITGITVLDQEINNNSAILATSQYAKGIYLLNLDYTGGSSSIKKLIKQ